MSAEAPEPKTPKNAPPSGAGAQEYGSVSEGVILERFKRMQLLPPHVRNLKDEFFVQSYLRRKRCAI